MNLLILQIYYNPDLCHFVDNRPFVISMVVISLDAFLFYYLFKRIGQYVKERQWDDVDSFVKRNTGLELQQYIDRDALMNDHESRYWARDPTAVDNNDDGIEDDDVCRATSTYMDVTRRFTTTVGLWVAQSLLVVFYMNHLNGDDTSKDVAKLQFLNWVCAVLLQLYVGDAQMGAPMNKMFWKMLWEQPLQEICPDLKSVIRQNPRLRCLSFTVRRTLGQCHESAGSIPLPFKAFWWCRYFFDATINKLARNIILFTFPIMLGAELPLDFVKDCLAVLFISTLDDLEESDKKDIPQMMVLLKYRLYLDAELCKPVEGVRESYRRLEETSSSIKEVREKRDKLMVLTTDELRYICDNTKKFKDLVRFESHGINIWKKMLHSALEVHFKQKELCQKVREYFNWLQV